VLPGRCDDGSRRRRDFKIAGMLAKKPPFLQFLPKILDLKRILP
jgi:hypothetical protein